MEFAEIVQQICDEVDRPEMTFKSQDGTGEAVRAAVSSVLTLHGREFYLRDIKEQIVILPASAYIFAVPVDALVRFRKVAYLRKWDPTWNSSQLDPSVQAPNLNMPNALNLLREISPDNLFDSYGYERDNVWYLAGTNLQCKSNTALTQVKVGFYQRPLVEPGEDGNYSLFDSWIAREYPYAVIYHAASKIFNSIGQNDNSRKYDRPPSAARNDAGGLVQEQIAIIDMNNIIGGMG